MALMSIFGHMFLAITQKVLMGAQETIIYRLVMRNSGDESSTIVGTYDRVRSFIVYDRIHFLKAFADIQRFVDKRSHPIKSSIFSSECNSFGKKRRRSYTFFYLFMQNK